MDGTLSPDKNFVLHGGEWIPALLSPSHTHYAHDGEWNLLKSPSNKPKIKVRIVRKSWFPVVKLTVIIKDPLNDINEKVSFSTMARTYTAKLANGTKIGTLPLKNITVYSGAEGMISFPNGHSYKVELMTGHFGPTGMIISDWDNSRKPTLVNFNKSKKK